MVASCDSLFLILTAIKGSLSVLAWSSLLLFAFLLLFALGLNQTLVTYIENPRVKSVNKETAFRYFGTFSRSILSMFELTLGNWVPINRFLIEEVNEWFIWFALLFKLTFGFAVVAVINGCFIKETFKAAEQDDELMIRQKQQEAKMHVRKMTKFLALADSSGEGRVSESEFIRVLKNDEVKQWLAAQGLDPSDAHSLFLLMDDGSGELTAEELVHGVASLKGPARSLDLARLISNVEAKEMRILSKIDDLYVMLSEDYLDLLANGQSAMSDHIQEMRRAVTGHNLGDDEELMSEYGEPYGPHVKEI
jgi:hypothetical protein